MFNVKLPEEDLKKVGTFVVFGGLYVKVYILVYMNFLEFYIKLFLNASILKILRYVHSCVGR